MANDPILHLLGLAKKAGKLEIGEEPVGAVCRARHARVVLLAKDAAPNTCRRAAHFGQAGNVLWLQLPHTKDELGFQLGRSSCAMLAVTDFGFAAAIGDKLAAMDPDRYGPAAQQLRQKSDRALQRQKEKRQHEKNVQMGKKKPWAAPPKETEEKTAAEKKGAATVRKSAAPSASKKAAPAKKTGFTAKPGLGGKKLTAKFAPGGRRPSGTKP